MGGSFYKDVDPKRPERLGGQLEQLDPQRELGRQLVLEPRGLDQQLEPDQLEQLDLVLMLAVLLGQLVLLVAYNLPCLFFVNFPILP